MTAFPRPASCPTCSVDPRAAAIVWAAAAIAFPPSINSLAFAWLAATLVTATPDVSSAALRVPATLVSVSNASACARAGLYEPLFVWGIFAVVGEVAARNFPPRHASYRGARFTLNVLDALSTITLAAILS